MYIYIYLHVCPMYSPKIYDIHPYHHTHKDNVQGAAAILLISKDQILVDANIQ